MLLNNVKIQSSFQEWIISMVKSYRLSKNHFVTFQTLKMCFKTQVL